MSKYILSMLFIPAVCVAGPLTADFSLGNTGNLHVNTLTVNGVTVNANGNLYRWNGNYCCDHDDYGLGVLMPNEGINPAEPELNGNEWLMLTKPENYLWDKLWFSSINDNSDLFVYYGRGRQSITAGVGIWATQKEGYISVPEMMNKSWSIWIAPNSVAHPTSNYSLFWGVDLKPVPEPIPEPGTLTLLGVGLVGLAKKLRR